MVRGGYSIAYINDEVIRSADNASIGNDGLSSTVSVTNVFGTLSGGNFNGAPTLSAQDLVSSVLVTPEFEVPRTISQNFALDSASASRRSSASRR